MKKILSMLTASTLATAMLATQVSAEYAGNFSFATKTDSIPGTKVTIDEEMSTSGTLLVTEGDFGPDATCIQIQSVSVGGNFEFVPTDVVTVTAEAANDEDTSAWKLAFNCYDSTWGGWNGPYGDAGVLEFSATIQEMMDSISVTDVEQFGGFIFQVWNCQVGDEINWTLSIAPGSDTPVEPDVPDEPDEPVPEEPVPEEPDTDVTYEEAFSTSGTAISVESDWGSDCTLIQIQTPAVGSGIELLPTDKISLSVSPVNPDVDTSSWSLGLSGYASDWSGWVSVSQEAGVLVLSTTVAEIMDANCIDDISDFGGFIAHVWNTEVGDEVNWELVVYNAIEVVPDVPEEPDEPVEPVEKDIDLLSSGSTYVDSETVRTDIYNEWSTNSDGIIVNSDDFVNVGSISVRIAVSDARKPFNAWLGYADSNWEYMYWGEDDEGNYGTSSDKIIVNGDGYYVINLSIDGYPSGLAFMTIYTDLYAEDESDIPSITIDAIRINGVLEDTDGDSYDPDIYFSYAELDDGTVIITDYTGSAANLTIPSKLNGKVVTSIGYSAFSGCTSLKTVIISDSVITISNRAFQDCTSLVSIDLPENLEELSAGCFENCTSLESIVIPDSVKYIYNDVFNGCVSLAEVDIPDNIEYFSSDVFTNTAIVNNQTTAIKYVENWAVACDEDITSASVKKGTVGIGGGAFQMREQLETITLPDGLVYIGSSAFDGCTSLTSVIIPDSVTIISEDAFSDTALKSITIPEGVTAINDFTFAGCKDLKTVNLPDTITSIGYDAFDECTSLKSITLPDSITAIGGYAFSYCTTLESIVIPNAVTRIEYNAFQNCTSLKTINIPASVTETGTTIFKNCSSLESVIISDGVKSINGYTFYDCPSLKSITIPESVTDIGHFAIGFDQDDETLDSVKVDGFKIYCYKDSAAHKYATDYGFDFELLGLAPTAVKGLSLGGRSGNALRLNWTKNTSADGYIIEMYKGGKWTRIARIAGNSTTTYRVTGLAAGTAYKFRMRAYKMDGTKALYSEYTSTFAARTNPSVVTGLKIGGRASNALRLNWTKNASADGYIIEQYKSGKWVRVARIAGNSTTTYRVSGLVASTQYKFRVKAYKMSGSTALYSGYTSTLAAYTNPSAVSNLKITGKAGTALRLGWSKNTSADGYIVEMYSGGKWVRIAKITSNATVTYRKAGLKKGTSYKFRVATYNVAGGTAYYGAYVNVNGTTNK